MLAWTIYISFLGAAALMLLPKESARSARALALLTACIGFLIAIAGTLHAKSGALQSIVRTCWVPSLGIEYHLAADGISLTLVLLTGIAAIAGILFRGTLSIGQRSSSRSTSRSSPASMASS